jgi:hypothetical protein
MYDCPEALLCFDRSQVYEGRSYSLDLHLTFVSCPGCRCSQSGSRHPPACAPVVGWSCPYPTGQDLTEGQADRPSAGVCQIVGRWDRRHPCKALGTARCSPLPSHCRSRRAQWKTRGAFRLCLLQSGMDRPNHGEVNQYLEGLRHPMISRTSVAIDNRSGSNRSRWEAGKKMSVK